MKNQFADTRSVQTRCIPPGTPGSGCQLDGVGWGEGIRTPPATARALLSQLMHGDVTKTKPCALGSAAEREAERRASTSLCARRSGRAPYIRRPRTRRGAPCAVSVLRVSLESVVVVVIVVVVAAVVGRALSSPRMPFISKDWRSPGEEWVKTVEGWEKKKILECANNKTLSLLLRGEKDAGDKKEKDKKKENAVQPHCHITLKCTREIAGFNGLSDALKRLDFLSAVHDCRRFNYIVRLLDLLVSHRMGGLSGCAQRVLFNMLEEVALEVSLSQQQTGRLRRLIERVRAFSAGCCWGGRPLGSVILWEKHKAALERILQIASSITITQPDEEQQPQWSDLPPECRREILLRLSDPRDIEASSEACEHLAILAQEQRIWRELAQYHFTPQQITTTRQNNPGKDWKTIFTIARRSFGLREEYAEMIQLCRNCRCLFWRSLGHPCIADQDPAFQEKLADVDQASLHVPIPPQTFLKFFSL